MRSRGFTLIELMVTVVVLAILITLAVPAFQGMQERKRVSALATLLAADIHLLRSEAVKRSANVRLVVSEEGYRIALGDTPIKVVDLEQDHPHTALASAAADNPLPLELVFDPRRERLLQGATALLVSSGDYQLQVAVNPLGYTRICGDFGGHPAC